MVLIGLLGAIGVVSVSPQDTISEDDLVLYGTDVRIEEKEQAGGFFIYIRNKPGITSVMLTESSERPSRDSNTYAYTAKKFNDINGHEKRVLNGRFIQPRSGFFIVDSTPEPDLAFGSAFILFLPYVVEFGYENTRNGSIDVRKEGLYMSIRTFEKSYASYEGMYRDNPFYLEKIEQEEEIPIAPTDLPPAAMVEKPPVLIPEIVPPTPEENQNVEIPVTVAADDPVTEAEEEEVLEFSETATESSLAALLSPPDGESEKYAPDTIATFQDIAAKAQSKAIFVENKNDIIDQINGILKRLPRNKSTDIVIMLDTTRSMWDDLAVIKSRLIPTISRTMDGQVYRIGLVLYRDIGEEYVTKSIDFTDQPESIQKTINEVQAGGGGDWPEAVYNALDIAVNEYKWISDNRVAFIVGDAPPHIPPSGNIDTDKLYTVASSKKIYIFPMIVPRR